MSTDHKTSFLRQLENHGLRLMRARLEILQVNVGKLCNQVCRHCHVEAGPKRTEIMEKHTVERVLDLLSSSDIHTVDITGGAPELNPHFRYLVTQSRKQGREVVDRCNLTVLFEAGQENTAEFLQENRVQIIASLPCYSRMNVDRQRGHAVFDKSIEALKLLNRLGYGMENTGLKLHLVYNPGGAYLPPSQSDLEKKYKEELGQLFGIQFNRLFTMTNMPIKRFLRELEYSGKLDRYMGLLVASFNPQAACGVMCRSQISVGWDGGLYDCDFNQMLEIPITRKYSQGSSAQMKHLTIWEISGLQEIEQNPIAFSDHCHGCTAGAGSSCAGALT